MRVRLSGKVVGKVGKKPWVGKISESIGAATKIRYMRK